MFRKARIRRAVLTQMRGISHSSPEAQSMCRMQLTEEPGLACTAVQEAGLPSLGRRSL